MDLRNVSVGDAAPFLSNLIRLGGGAIQGWRRVEGRGPHRPRGPAGALAGRSRPVL